MITREQIFEALKDLRLSFPCGQKCRVSSNYGARGKWWNWHIDINGIWHKGQINGIGVHKGIDWRVEVGTPVMAMIDGVCEAAGYENPSELTQGFGLRVKQSFIKNGLTFFAFYGHLSKLNIQAGDKIVTGQIIGYSGNTGHSSGAHLHTELRDCQGQPHPQVFEFKLNT